MQHHFPRCDSSELAGIQPDIDLIVEPQPLLLRVTNGPSIYYPNPDGHLEISLYVLLSDTSYDSNSSCCV